MKRRERLMLMGGRPWRHEDWCRQDEEMNERGVFLVLQGQKATVVRMTEKEIQRRGLDS